ncbi:TlpA family protein disulfide reductase [Edaphobacter albus]|uniref:TlpA family protein disulfide reductase n=1 Tax=Edaphobacter sp. 4G125 TaxID=2763071 RepID=UPI0016475D9B|nr:hypothetical protein [Edaphobacter sp. 4G125]QNI37400.1 hypothetical protein H7846_03545 [Edaphobacter sp. 4G125]
MKNKLETITNVVLLVVTLLVGGGFLYNQFNGAKDSASQQVIGRHINLGADHAFQADRTLILFISTDCQYCIASTPFYKRLVQAHPKTPIIAAFPQKEDVAREYLAKHQIPISEVISAPQLLQETTGTPTLMLVDKTGKVKNAWVGRLSPTTEKEVFKQIGL